jgi:hypothetical protein
MPTPAKFTGNVLLAAGNFFAGYLANRQAVPVAFSASVQQVRPAKYVHEMAAHDITGTRGTK